MKKSLFRNLALCGAALAVAVLAPDTANAANILVNPGFELNSGNNIPTGWSYFKPSDAGFGSYWIDNAGNRQHSGTYYYKEWGLYWDASRTNIAGIYQDFNSAPTSVYQASGWFFTVTGDSMGPNNVAWLEVAFLNDAKNPIALYKSADFNSTWGLDTWFNLEVTNVCDLAQVISTGDPSFPTYAVTGTVSQLVAPAGTKYVRYRHAHTQGGGWPEGGGACQFDDAVLNQLSGPLPPIIGSVFPNNLIFVNPADGITFTASSPSGTAINAANIKLVLNGTDVSSALEITGTDSSKTVAYRQLGSNETYTAEISVTDAYAFTVNASTWFQTTWVGVPPGVYIWEAEDFDFDGGSYINNPELCSVDGNPNCYFGKVGVQGVDENNQSMDGDHAYRPNTGMATTGSGDYLRPNLAAAGRNDYKVGWFPGGEWVNYTRDFTPGTYWIIARLANGGGSGSLTLSKVNPDTSTTTLGTFTIDSGRGWTTYDYFYLKDATGNNANITLDGKTTLRATTGGNVDMGFFMLVKAQLDLPVLSGLYPTGSQPFEATNTLSFNVSSAGGTFNQGNIKMTLDGADVSSRLQITGTASSKSIVYPGLLLNAPHTATITVTNDNGTGLAITRRFDTFSQNNYIVQAEDFDFGGGLFTDNPVPSGYFTNLVDAVTNVDYHHTYAGGEQYYYRPVGIPNGVVGDFKLQRYVDVFETDYSIGYFQNGDWANYTRTYPAGKYLVYGRFSGGGGYSMYLDKVTAGLGTTTQTTKRLGRWGAVGRGWDAYDWVPLTDEGLAAPILLTLGGKETLRLVTTGGANANYIMLVPISGISVTTAKVGGSISISFATQAGATYRVFYRDDLFSGTWNLLTTVAGDGAVKSATDTIGGGKRFYQIVSP